MEQNVEETKNQVRFMIFFHFIRICSQFCAAYPYDFIKKII